MGALIAIALPDSQREVMKLASAGIAVAALGFSLYVFVAYDNGLREFQFQTDRYDWLSGLGVTFHLGVDGIATPINIMPTLILMKLEYGMWL